MDAREPTTRCDFELAHDQLIQTLENSPGRKQPIVPSNPGLLLIDPQRIFCDSRSPAYCHGWSTAAGNALALCALFFELGRPVAVTRHLQDGNGISNRFLPRPIRRDDPLSELIPEITSIFPEKTVVEKDRFNALAGPEVLSRFLDCAELILIGVQTHRCVLATALAAADSGFVPVVVSDACAAPTFADHRRALSVLAAGHAAVRTTGEIIAICRELQR